MYLAQIISSGSHVHYIITAPVPGPPAVITMNAKQQFKHNYINGGKGNIQQQQYNSITVLLKMLLRFHHKRKITVSIGFLE